MTGVYKSDWRHADCLSRAPVKAEPASTDDYDECCFGAVNVSDLAALERADPELRVLIEHLEGTTVPRVFLTSPANLCHSTMCAVQRELG